MRKVDDRETMTENVKRNGGKEKKIMTEIVATALLPFDRLMAGQLQCPLSYQ